MNLLIHSRMNYIGLSWLLPSFRALLCFWFVCRSRSSWAVYSRTIPPPFSFPYLTIRVHFGTYSFLFLSFQLLSTCFHSPSEKQVIPDTALQTPKVPGNRKVSKGSLKLPSSCKRKPVMTFPFPAGQVCESGFDRPESPSVPSCDRYPALQSKTALLLKEIQLQTLVKVTAYHGKTVPAHCFFCKNTGNLLLK